MKHKHRILLGVSSGIAAFKVIDLINKLQDQGLEVVVMMTKNAKNMISVDELATITNNRVFIDLYPEGFNYRQILDTRHVDHIYLADTVDLVAIVPATANIIGKLSHGIADDFVTTTVLATRCPVLVFPSMNIHMWNHPAVKENCRRLKQLGYIVIDPDSGPLACGYEGKGRLPRIEVITEEILRTLHTRKTLQGKRILVTAGGTQEKIDEVRSITNKSSGKMGVAIADAAFEYGARVTLLRSVSSVEPRYSVKTDQFTSSVELQKLIQHYISDVDIIIHAAAVSDFAPSPANTKLSSKTSHTILLSPQTKILDQIKIWNPSVCVIGFKAGYGLTEKVLTTVARKRLEESKAEMIVANDIAQSDRGFGSDMNEVQIVTKTSSVKIPLQSKREIARILLKHIIRLQDDNI